MKKVIIIVIVIVGSLASLHAQTGKPFLKNFAATEYKAHNSNFQIYCNKDGRVFVANFEGLLMYDGVVWKTFHTPGISRITSLYAANDGSLWFGGNNILGNVSTKDSIAITYIVRDDSKKKTYGDISNIGEENGKIFFTANEKRYRVDGDKVTAVQSPESRVQSPEDVSAFITDQNLTARAVANEGVVVTDRNGQERYRITADDGLCSNNVNSLSYDGKGCLWGATDNGLFVIYVSPVFTHYNEMNGLVGQVTTILHDGTDLYVGTLQGLFHLGQNDRFERVGEIQLACWQLATSADGAKYAATAEGVYYHKGSTRQVTKQHTLSLISVSNTDFITGELDGIYRHTISGGTEKIGDAQNVVKFERDSDGNIWAVSLSKLTYCLAPGSKKFVEKANDKLTVLFRYTDEEGRKWYSKNNKGLYCDKLNANQKNWCNALSDYSIQTMDMNGDVAYVGGNFGVVRFNITDMRRIPTYKPELYIRDFIQDGGNVQINFSNDKNDPIGKSYYSYRLHDDDDWINCGTDKDIPFVNMTPGHYHFTARSKDAYGNVVMSKTMEFDVPPPFFMKWYMILLYLLILAGLIYLFIRWRMRRLKNEQLRLESLVDERTQELRSAQNQLIRREREATVGKLTKGLIDRILNPMNYINNFSHITSGLVKDLKENIEDEKENMSEDNFEDSMDVLEMMQTNLGKIEDHGMSTTRILKAMEELLKENPDKEKETMNLGPLCQQNIEVFNKYYEEDIKKYNIQVECEKPSTPVVADVYGSNLDKVIKMMLANSIYAVKKKYDKLGGKDYNPVVKIKLIVDEQEKPVISVYDNGIGIEEQIQDKVFDPFFTTKPTGEAPGVGLYMSQQIVQDMGGTISMKSVKDEYTEFTISLP